MINAREGKKRFKVVDDDLQNVVPPKSVSCLPFRQRDRPTHHDSGTPIAFPHSPPPHTSFANTSTTNIILFLDHLRPYQIRLISLSRGNAQE